MRWLSITQVGKTSLFKSGAEMHRFFVAKNYWFGGDGSGVFRIHNDAGTGQEMRKNLKLVLDKLFKMCIKVGRKEVAK